MKFRYIVFYFLIGWIIVLFVSTILEKQAIGIIARDVNSTVSLAAEMAINTVQASDEFFKGDTTMGAYDIYVPYNTGGKDVGYKRANLYIEMAEKIWGVDISTASVGNDQGSLTIAGAKGSDKNKEKIYNFMYGTGNKSMLFNITNETTEFANYLIYVGNPFNQNTNIPLTNIVYLDGKDGDYELKYGVMPLITRMGADTISSLSGALEGGTSLALYYKQKGSASDTVSLNYIYNNYNTAFDFNKGGYDTVYHKYGSISPDTTFIDTYVRVAQANGFRTSKKESSIYGRGSYFVTPLSIGMTYLDNDLLSYCFINNMDLFRVWL